MLSQVYSSESLADLLLPADQYHPFPTRDDREEWSALPSSVKEAHLERGRALLGFDYPSLPATLFLQFARNGNRERYQKPHFIRRSVLEELTLAECIEGEGRFLDDIANGIWAICEESYWGVPAHIRVQKAGNTLPDVAEPTVDLFAAETGNLLAWVHYLLGDSLDGVSPLVRQRIELEMDRRILTPLWERNDFMWMGLERGMMGRRVNNWNPWICSNWLSATLLMEENDKKRAETVAKIMLVLDQFVDPYPDDGGCDEGPNYWGRAGASLFDNLELLYGASNGAIDHYDDEKVREIGRFVYRVHIDDDYYINFADAPALVYPDGLLVYLYGVRIEDSAMQDHGLWLTQRQKTASQGYVNHSPERVVNFQRSLRGLFALATLPERPGMPPQVRDVWLPEIEVVVARDEAGSAEGFFLGAKGGHNAESHNHNDIGNFIVYRNGRPLVIDAGVETYTAKTFSADRYEIWTMQSAYHSLLPTVDGVQQEAGAEFQARNVTYQADGDRVEFTLDIAPAYPEEAGIESWERRIVFDRGEGIDIEDRFEFSRDIKEIMLAILTPASVDLGQSGSIRLNERPILDGRLSAAGSVTYDGELFSADVESIPLNDERMRSTWGEEIYRIRLTVQDPPRSGTWRFHVAG